jgi:hypothetical protein
MSNGRFVSGLVHLSSYFYSRMKETLCEIKEMSSGNPQDDKHRRQVGGTGSHNKTEKVYHVTVSMIIDEEGKGVIDKKQIDFGKMDFEALKELTDMFNLMSKDIDQIKRLKPQFEKIEKTKPEYLD